MATFLGESSYGKSHVRLTKVTRKGDFHELKEMSVSIQLQGDFDRSYTHGDNSQVVPTDTMKNTVYAMAAQHTIDNIESFAAALARHFLTRHSQVHAVSVEIQQERFERINTNGKPHEHAFLGGNKEKRVANIQMRADRLTIESGIEDLVVLKTGNSEFSGFVRDEYTSLADTHDRIFATSVIARWTYNRQNADYDLNHAKIKQIIIDVFATHKSLAVQQTLYEMGKVVLEQCADVDEIRLSMPNQHRLPVDLSGFGLPNKNEIFVPTAEPFGLISASMVRTPSKRIAGATA
jgi:urate oxidase